MRKVVFLALGLSALVTLGPNDGLSQPGHDGSKSHAPTTATKFSKDPMEMFDRISRGKGYITADDVANMEACQTDFQSFMGTIGNATARISREEYFAVVEWRREQLKLQKQLARELKRQRELAGEDVDDWDLPPAAGSAQPQDNGDKSAKKHQQPLHQPQPPPQQFDPDA